MSQKLSYDLVIFDWEGTLRAAGRLHPDLVPGAKCVLKALKKQQKLIAVATGCSTRGLAHEMDILDVSSYFDTTRTAEQTACKPCPQMLDEIISQCGVSAEKTLMVGDSECDMEMAALQGCDALGVDFHRCNRQRLHAAGAKAVINDYADFFDALGIFPIT